MSISNKAEPSNSQKDVSAAEVILLDAVRSILLKQDRETLRLLEERLLRIEQYQKSGDEALQEEIQYVGDQLTNTQNQVNILDRKAREDAEGMVERLTPVMTNLVRRTIYDSPTEMAEAIGPVMGEAIRVQIRDSRDDMIGTLSPIIGTTVQKAIGEFARELQRNVDARLRSTINPKSFIRRFGARLRGISDSDLTLRDAFPFNIEEVFLIQHGSGLLIAHSNISNEEDGDSDLIGAMLTAIRDFVRDSFSDDASDQELDEVSYGDQRIVVQSGRYSYLAVVFSGIEPEGFRAALRNLVAELHDRYGSFFRDYNGDLDSLPDFQTILGGLNQDILKTADRPVKMPRIQRNFIIGAVLGLVLLITVSCFYLRFTIALLPIAFPTSSLTPTFSSTPTTTQTLTPTQTPSSTPTLTPTRTFTPTPTQTSSPTFTLTPSVTPSPTLTLTPADTPTPSLTPTPVEAIVIGNVWVHMEPSRNAQRFTTLPVGTPVKVIGVYGDWYNILWVSESGVLAGWSYSEWIDVLTPLPPSIFTPSPTATITIEP